MQAPHAPDRTRRASSPSGGMQDPDAEDSAAFTSTLIDVQGPPPSAHNAHGSSNGPHHAPSNNGHPGFVQFHQQQQQHHGHHWGVGHQPARHAGLENMDEDDRWPTGACVCACVCVCVLAASKLLQNAAGSMCVQTQPSVLFAHVRSCYSSTLFCMSTLSAP
eukprot:1150464-Pelagomonas_calceolata.AAC.2